MFFMYHILAGLITMFAAMQTLDGKALLRKIKENAVNENRGSGADDMWEVALHMSICAGAWLIFWPIAILAWSLYALIEPKLDEEN